MIKAFEYTYELAWNLLRDYFIYQGNNSITGSRDAFREAVNKEIITDAHEWMNMILDRNRTSYVCNQETSDSISRKIIEVYAGLFNQLSEYFKADRP